MLFVRSAGSLASLLAAAIAPTYEAVRAEVRGPRTEQLPGIHAALVKLQSKDQLVAQR